MKIRTVIVENQKELRDQVRGLLAFYHEFELIGEFDDVNQASRFILEKEVDAAFIQSSVGDPRTSPDGNFLLSYITKKKPDLLAVLYSDSRDQAYWALSVGAAAVFTTPVDYQYFQQVIRRLLYLFDLLLYKRNSQARSVMLRAKGGYQMIRLSDILFVERNHRKISMVCTGGTEIEVTSYTMDELESLLQNHRFYRCYSSFIVNLDKVLRINIDSGKRIYTVALEGFDGELILSREKYRDLLSLLQQRYSDIILER